MTAHEPNRRALILGALGQDGILLTKLLLEEGVEVYAGYRPEGNGDGVERLSLPREQKGLHFLEADLNEEQSLVAAFKASCPHEVYNLAAQSSVAKSFADPIGTLEVNGAGVVRVLDILRKYAPQARVFLASSAELFGSAAQGRQSESAGFAPQNPYGASKLYSFTMGQIYRSAYGLFLCQGILFNHESIYRPPTFVTRKITLAAARCATGKQDCVALGNLNAVRDWTAAEDVVRAMTLALRHSRPDDYVIGSGSTHTIRDVCDIAFSTVGMPLRWRGDGLAERGESADGISRVVVDPRYFRPCDPSVLVGDFTKIQAAVGWHPRVSFADLIATMARHDLAADSLTA